MSLSSKRSTTIPLSFDRFRVKSTQFLSPFRHHHCDRRIKRSPERSWIRNVQVHPNNVQSSESERIDYDASYLFHANKRSNSKKSQKCLNNMFNTRSTSNVTGVFDAYQLPITNTSRPSEPEIIRSIYQPTSCMIGYRHSSLPNLVPTHVIEHPTSFDQSN